MAIFDFDGDRSQEKSQLPAQDSLTTDGVVTASTKSAASESENVQLGTFQIEQLGEIAELVRNDINVMDYKNGWFGKQIRVVYGGDIYKWIIDHVESNEKKAKQMCQKMLEKEIISNVDNKLDFSNKDLYRMYMDREDIADNMLRRWKDQVRGALEVSGNLVKMIEQVYEQSIVNPEDGCDDDDDEEQQQQDNQDPESMIDAEAALKSTQYKMYLNAACELERVSLGDLTVRERIAFFLNVYQCMYIHYFLKAKNEIKGQADTT